MEYLDETTHPEEEEVQDNHTCVFDIFSDTQEKCIFCGKIRDLTFPRTYKR